MKPNWAGGWLFAIALSIPASAQIGVYIRVAPPPLGHERRGAMPGPGYTWVDGYGNQHGATVVRVGWRWDRLPYEGPTLGYPHCDHCEPGWQMHEGHRDHEGHDRPRTRAIVARAGAG
jgi:hypothetical protein